MYGFIVEKSLRAKNIDSLNRTAISTTTDFDGGNLVVLTAGTSAEAPYTASAPSANSTTGCWMAYNPAEALSIVSGKTFAGLSADPRDYTNGKNRPFSVFKPMKYDIVGFTKDCFDATLTASVDNTYYVGVKGSQSKLTCSSSALSGTSFKVISHGTLPFPASINSIGMSNYEFVVGECVVE